MGEREGQGTAFEGVTKPTGKSITRMRRWWLARSLLHGLHRRRTTQSAHILPTTLDELIPQDHVCRVIEAFVGRLDMAKLGFVRSEPAETGRPGYDPRDLLKLYLYGYLWQIRSSRRLETECSPRSLLQCTSSAPASVTASRCIRRNSAIAKAGGRSSSYRGS
jgi:Transposase domain (DUF772)